MNLRHESRKLRILIRINVTVFEVIFHPKNLSPSGDWVSFGQYYKDELRGWYLTEEVEVVEVLQVMPPEEVSE